MINDGKMNLFHTVLIGIAVILSTKTHVQSAVPGETRIKTTVDLIASNVTEETEKNTLHPQSIYYAIINKINRNIKNLLPLSPAEYVHVTAGNDVLNVSPSGTDVILARFPSSGNLTVFGLTPSVIKSIALPS